MVEVAAGEWLGEWLLEERLGEGGCAVVFRARRGADEVAAVKVPRAPRAAEVWREATARRLLELDHPHAVRVLALAAEHDPPYQVLEYVAGTSLRERLGDDACAPDQALRWIEEVAGALDCAHALGLLHLDVKPENVLIDASGAARLTDFGGIPPTDSERLATSLPSTGSLQAAATVDYAAPEHRRGGALDARADVFGLAALAFELLTGCPPVGLDRPSELRPSLPRAVDAVFARALSVEPGRRPASCGEFARDLARAFAAEGLPVAGAAPADRGAAGAAPSPGTPPEDPERAEPPAWEASTAEETLGASSGLRAGFAPLRAEAPPRPRRRRWRLAARSATPLLAAGLLAGWFLAAPRREEVRGHPRIRALLARAPAGSRVGLLLPLRDLGAPGRGWSRDGAELWDAFPAQRPRIPLWVRGGYARLYERSERAALERSGGCDLAVYAVAPAEAGALADDALLFLVDLPSYRLRAATPVNDPAVVELAGRLGVLDGAATPDPLVVLPSLDAARRVSNRSLAWFDACLTANLVERLRRVSLRARGGLEPRLAAFAGDARRALSVGTTLRCVYDHAAGRLVATVRDAARGKELYSCEVPLRLSGYDPLQDAGAFSADPRAVALAREADPRRALARGLEQARALLFEQDPGRALEVLEAVRARGLPVADDPDLLLLLARAQRELGQRAEARALLAEALRSHPEVAAVREAYAREVLDAARRRYRQGKRPWYADDDEERFREAIELLKPTRDLEVSEDLRRDLDAWMRRLEGEL